MRCWILAVALLLPLAACSPGNAGSGRRDPPTELEPVDADEDGSPVGPGGDCDDTDPSVHPGAFDVPYDGVDQDCNGTDLVDLDADGHAAATVGGPDCDDRRPAVHPGADELCDDGLDQDCDGGDEPCGAGGTGGGPGDDDGDGYAEVDGDCDDTRADVHPGAAEIPGDGIDQDCSGSDLVDLDGDGYRATSVGGTDCDDGNAAVHPGALDACGDGLDADCRGGDPDCPTPPTDRDGDGHASLAAGGDDCDDTRADVHPSAREIPFDTIDQDCDGNDLAPERETFTIATETVGVPSVVATSAGFLVAAPVHDDVDEVLLVRPLDLSGAPSGPPVELDRSPWSEEDRTSVLLVPADGGAVALWSRGFAGVSIVRLQASGRPTAAAARVPDSYAQAAQWDDGGLLTAWEEWTSSGIPDLFVRQFSPTLEPGPSWQAGTGDRPSLALDADGTPLLARTRSGSGTVKVEVHRLESTAVEVFSHEDWSDAVLSPRSRRIAATTPEGLAVLVLGSDDAFRILSYGTRFHAWAEEGSTAVLGWSGLTPETPTDGAGMERGYALHLTVFEGASTPRTLDVFAQARNGWLRGIALRDGRVLVVFSPDWTGELRGLIVRL